MSIELRVAGERQRTEMSCWWTCMAMVLRYYGRRYVFPWDFRRAFELPAQSIASPLGVGRYPTLGEAMAPDGTLRSIEPLYTERPWEWYERGVPPNARAFRVLSSITGFTGMGRDHTEFGRWTADDFENRLRASGPFLFFGYWNADEHHIYRAHVILIVGLLRQGSDVSVISIDPARGFAAPAPIDTFNARMRDSRMRDSNFGYLNPMYLPQRQPVLDTVVDTPDD